MIKIIVKPIISDIHFKSSPRKLSKKYTNVKIITLYILAVKAIIIQNLA